tara:strand:- start:418 stop:672 length:255 start_codon:yes stop_codon:yes gene_type:complete
MFELKQFPQWPFCLKIRMVLDAKALNYKTTNLTPGIDQLKLFKLCRPKKSTVLIYKEHLIHDSHEIVKYIERLHPEPLIIPPEP